jgi:anti-sigma B factor antagonist
MSLTVIIKERREGAYLVTLEGRLDSNTHLEFEEKMAPLLRGSAKSLILNMEKMDYLSSMGLRSIVIAKKAIKSHNGDVVMINLQPQIQKLFEIVSALPQESVFASIKEADEYFDFIQKKEIEKLGNLKKI